MSRFFKSKRVFKSKQIIPALIVLSFMSASIGNATAISQNWFDDDLFNTVLFNADTIQESKGSADHQSLSFKLAAGATLSINTQIGSKEQCKNVCNEKKCHEEIEMVPTEECMQTYERSYGRKVTAFAEVIEPLPGDPKIVTDSPLPGNPRIAGGLPGNPHIVNKLPGDPRIVKQKKWGRKVAVQKQSICKTVMKEVKKQVCDAVPTCVTACYKNPVYSCVDVVNRSSEAFFIPNKTFEEFSSFIHNPPAGVDISECARRYSLWEAPDESHQGVADWLNKQPAGTALKKGSVCHLLHNTSSEEIVLRRRCETSLGRDTALEDCAGDARIPDIEHDLGGVQKVTCGASAQ